MRPTWTSCLLGVLLATASTSASQPATSACALSPADRAWIDRTMDAWNHTSRDITGIGRVKRITAVLFDDRCEVLSRTAMNGGPKSWTARAFTGQVPLPNGEKIPPGVISFAMGDEKSGENFFVMSTPSVWRAANKSANGLESLELLMTAVVLHEATHVAQMPTYGQRIGRLAEAHKLPEDFNDDTIQKRFEGERDFKDSVSRETDLLLAAATARDDSTAIRLAGDARNLMKARQARWYTGADGYLAEAEDVFLTLEGSAQWAAYQWLVDPRGGAADPRLAFGSFAWHGKWWSQNEGFALFMALDRLAGAQWKRHAFGDGQKTALQMLDEALAAGASSAASSQPPERG
jgi:hypothetical protein